MVDPAPGDGKLERPAPAVTPLPGAKQVPPPARRYGLQSAVRIFLLSVVPMVALLAGIHVWVSGGRFIETDNAYARADKVAISPEVSGRVIDVAVSTNQHVAAGEILFRIDDEPHRIALEQADAQLDMVRTEIGVLRSKYSKMREQLMLAETDAAHYEREYRRQTELAARNVVSGVKVDNARHAMDMALRQVDVREQELAEILARLGGDPEMPEEKFARFINARTHRDEAARDLRNTVARAPADGIVGRVGIRPGTFVESGKPVISVVETADLWFEANLKEGDLTHIRVGHPATVRVDAYPDREWTAKVTSLSPATGAEFALLPSQNATGNWVKVVQRVPVRLRIERAPDDPPLRVGMSATVSIDTGYQRSLPDFFSTLSSWIWGSS